MSPQDDPDYPSDAGAQPPHDAIPAPDSAADADGYSIESAAEIARVTRHSIAVYCRHGLVSPVGEPETDGWRFDDDAIHQLRRLSFLREQYGVNIAGLRAISSLVREVERLTDEVRFLRGR